jgi:hypothetical protein
MIALFFDGLTAVVKTIDRVITAAEQNVRLQSTPRTVDDARPAGTDPRLGVGGHPIRSTSELLWNAVSELDFAYPGPQHAVIVRLTHELSDRAAELSAVGD